MKEQPVAWRVLTLNTIAFTACFACWMLNGVLVTFLVENGVFDWDAAQMGTLIGIPVLTGSIMRLPVGMLTDRFGGRPVYTALMLLCAVPMYLLSHVDSYGGYLLASLGFRLLHVYRRIDRDLTGNRRIWPIAVGEIDLKGFEKARDQLWAEAVAREAKGESIILSPELWQVAAAAQKDRMAEDPYADVLRGAFADACGKVSMEAIKRLLGIQTARMGSYDARRIRSIMGELDWVPGTYWLYDTSRGERRPKKGFARGNENEAKIEFGVTLAGNRDPRLVAIDEDGCESEIPF